MTFKSLFIACIALVTHRSPQRVRETYDMLEAIMKDASHFTGLSHVLLMLFPNRRFVLSLPEGRIKFLTLNGNEIHRKDFIVTPNADDHTFAINKQKWRILIRRESTEEEWHGQDAIRVLVSEKIACLWLAATGISTMAPDALYVRAEEFLRFYLKGEVTAEARGVTGGLERYSPYYSLTRELSRYLMNIIECWMIPASVRQRYNWDRIDEVNAIMDETAALEDVVRRGALWLYPNRAEFKRTMLFSRFITQEQLEEMERSNKHDFVDYLVSKAESRYTNGSQDWKEIMDVINAAEDMSSVTGTDALAQIKETCHRVLSTMLGKKTSTFLFSSVSGATAIQTLALTMDGWLSRLAGISLKLVEEHSIVQCTKLAHEMYELMIPFAREYHSELMATYLESMLTMNTFEEIIGVVLRIRGILGEMTACLLNGFAYIDENRKHTIEDGLETVMGSRLFNEIRNKRMRLLVQQLTYKPDGIKAGNDVLDILEAGWMSSNKRKAEKKRYDIQRLEGLDRVGAACPGVTIKIEQACYSDDDIVARLTEFSGKVRYSDAACSSLTKTELEEAKRIRRLGDVDETIRVEAAATAQHYMEHIIQFNKIEKMLLSYSDQRVRDVYAACQTRKVMRNNLISISTVFPEVPDAVVIREEQKLMSERQSGIVGDELIPREIKAEVLAAQNNEFPSSDEMRDEDLYKILTDIAESDVDYVTLDSAKLQNAKSAMEECWAAVRKKLKATYDLTSFDEFLDKNEIFLDLTGSMGSPYDACVHGCSDEQRDNTERLNTLIKFKNSIMMKQDPEREDHEKVCRYLVSRIRHVLQECDEIFHISGYYARSGAIIYCKKKSETWKGNIESILSNKIEFSTYQAEKESLSLELVKSTVERDRSVWHPMAKEMAELVATLVETETGCNHFCTHIKPFVPTALTDVIDTGEERFKTAASRTFESVRRMLTPKEVTPIRLPRSFYLRNNLSPFLREIADIVLEQIRLDLLTLHPEEKDGCSKVVNQQHARLWAIYSSLTSTKRLAIGHFIAQEIQGHVLKSTKPTYLVRRVGGDISMVISVKGKKSENAYVNFFREGERRHLIKYTVALHKLSALFHQIYVGWTTFAMRVSASGMLGLMDQYPNIDYPSACTEKELSCVNDITKVGHEILEVFKDPKDDDYKKLLKSVEHWTDEQDIVTKLTHCASYINLVTVPALRENKLEHNGVVQNLRYPMAHGTGTIFGCKKTSQKLIAPIRSHPCQMHMLFVNVACLYSYSKVGKKYDRLNDLYYNRTVDSFTGFQHVSGAADWMNCMFWVQSHFKYDNNKRKLTLDAFENILDPMMKGNTRISEVLTTLRNCERPVIGTQETPRGTSDINCLGSTHLPKPRNMLCRSCQESYLYLESYYSADIMEYDFTPAGNGYKEKLADVEWLLKETLNNGLKMTAGVPAYLRLSARCYIDTLTPDRKQQIRNFPRLHEPWTSMLATSSSLRGGTTQSKPGTIMHKFFKRRQMKHSMTTRQSRGSTVGTEKDVISEDDMFMLQKQVDDSLPAYSEYMKAIIDVNFRKKGITGSTGLLAKHDLDEVLADDLFVCSTMKTMCKSLRSGSKSYSLIKSMFKEFVKDVGKPKTTSEHGRLAALAEFFSTDQIEELATGIENIDTEYNTYISTEQNQKAFNHLSRQESFSWNTISEIPNLSALLYCSNQRKALPGYTQYRTQMERYAGMAYEFRKRDKDAGHFDHEYELSQIGIQMEAIHKRNELFVFLDVLNLFYRMSRINVTQCITYREISLISLASSNDFVDFFISAFGEMSDYDNLLVIRLMTNRSHSSSLINDPTAKELKLSRNQGSNNFILLRNDQLLLSAWDMFMQAATGSPLKVARIRNLNLNLSYNEVRSDKVVTVFVDELLGMCIPGTVHLGLSLMLQDREMQCTVAPKQQLGGTRDIVTLIWYIRVMMRISETMDGAILKGDGDDLMENAPRKEEFLQTYANFATLIEANRGDYKWLEGWAVDRTSWGQGMAYSAFLAVKLPILKAIGPKWYKMQKTIYTKMQQKKVFIPDLVIDSILSALVKAGMVLSTDGRITKKNGDVATEEDLSFLTATQRYVLQKHLVNGEVYIGGPGHMLQGIPHRGSSTHGLACAYMEKCARKAVAKRWGIERVLFRHVMSSDDAATMVLSPEKLSDQTRKRLARLSCVAQKSCVMQESSKTSRGGPIEVYSQYAATEVIPDTPKALQSILYGRHSTNVNDQGQQSFNLCQEAYRKGGTQFQVKLFYRASVSSISRTINGTSLLTDKRDKFMTAFKCNLPLCYNPVFPVTHQTMNSDLGTLTAQNIVNIMHPVYTIIAKHRTADGIDTVAAAEEVNNHGLTLEQALACSVTIDKDGREVGLFQNNREGRTKPAYDSPFWNYIPIKNKAVLEKRRAQIDNTTDVFGGKLTGVHALLMLDHKASNQVGVEFTCARSLGSRGNIRTLQNLSMYDIGLALINSVHMPRVFKPLLVDCDHFMVGQGGKVLTLSGMRDWKVKKVEPKDIKHISMIYDLMTGWQHVDSELDSMLKSTMYGARDVTITSLSMIPPMATSKLGVYGGRTFVNSMSTIVASVLDPNISNNPYYTVRVESLDADRDLLRTLHPEAYEFIERQREHFCDMNVSRTVQIAQLANDLLRRDDSIESEDEGLGDVNLRPQYGNQQPVNIVISEGVESESDALVRYANLREDELDGVAWKKFSKMSSEKFDQVASVIRTLSEKHSAPVKLHYLDTDPARHRSWKLAISKKVELSTVEGYSVLPRESVTLNETDVEFRKAVRVWREAFTCINKGRFSPTVMTQMFSRMINEGFMGYKPFEVLKELGNELDTRVTHWVSFFNAMQSGPTITRRGYYITSKHASNYEIDMITKGADIATFAYERGDPKGNILCETNCPFNRWHAIVNLYLDDRSGSLHKPQNKSELLSRMTEEQGPESIGVGDRFGHLIEMTASNKRVKLIPYLPASNLTRASTYIDEVKRIGTSRRGLAIGVELIKPSGLLDRRYTSPFTSQNEGMPPGFGIQHYRDMNDGSIPERVKALKRRVETQAAEFIPIVVMPDVTSGVSIEVANEVFKIASNCSAAPINPSIESEDRKYNTTLLVKAGSITEAFLMYKMRDEDELIRIPDGFRIKVPMRVQDPDLGTTMPDLIKLLNLAGKWTHLPVDQVKPYMAAKALGADVTKLTGMSQIMETYNLIKRNNRSEPDTGVFPRQFRLGDPTSIVHIGETRETFYLGLPTDALPAPGGSFVQLDRSGSDRLINYMLGLGSEIYLDLGLLPPHRGTPTEKLHVETSPVGDRVVAGFNFGTRSSRAIKMLDNVDTFSSGILHKAVAALLLMVDDESVTVKGFAKLIDIISDLVARMLPEQVSVAVGDVVVYREVDKPEPSNTADAGLEDYPTDEDDYMDDEI